MKLKFFLPLMIFFPVVIIQLTVIPFISIQEVVPDLLLITVVYFSILYGQVFGTVTGASYGLMFDLISGNLIGSSMLSKTVAGFIAGYFSSETRRDKYLYTYSFSMVVFITGLIDAVIFSFFSVIDFNTNILQVLFNHALMPSIYTSVISILVIIVPYKRTFLSENR
ncbi:MAG: rod shape-determining protein MreD [Ignavibacteriaceae bacterium]|jgi:rod shape-determining protein MreD|nr:rod shape-determining protein MreD [Chlorobium sp.]MCW8961880.1 rod shape-determining protein MreD [Ignavibacteriaceae bacterium]MCW8996888.1 rod shape-determining protein MreD [Psychromonas sp.]MCW9095397.1 rod shape-determining protein MreD [Ignavibacteriaceae bacterium]MCW9097503.1 rod shape-determining protein MreD [Ignavibacteriaceae bacterium]